MDVIMQRMLTLLYPFLPSISQQIEEQKGSYTIISDDMKIILVIIFMILIVVSFIIQGIRHLAYFDHEKNTSIFHPIVVFPATIILFICFIPTERDIRVSLQEEIITKHESTIDATISQWMNDNDIPQYKLCNEKMTYVYGEGLDMARYKTTDTLLCGGINSVENFHILDKNITIEIKDDGIYGVVN